MSLKSSKLKSASNRVAQPQLESDVYPAYLVQIIDLGLQPQKPYKGEEKSPQHEISLTYELCDVFMVDEKGEELKDSPRWLSETMPFYSISAEKAKSSKRYLALDPQNTRDGDFSALIGIPCNVTVVINQVGDKTYTNIGHVAPMGAKKVSQMAPLKNPTVVFDLDAPDIEVFNKFPEWIREKIKSNLNYSGSPLQKMLGSPPEVKLPVKAKVPKVEVVVEEEDNPY